MGILVLIIGLFLFIALIVIHEFGHFIVARRNGVDAEEFSIFFGPSVYKRRTKSGLLFRIGTIPLGGYVKLKGEHDSDVAKGSYGAASLSAKSKIMAAGVISNLISGFILFVILALIGMPQIFPNQFTVKSNAHVVKQVSTTVQVAEILSGSPASKSGLKDGDYITYIGPESHLVKITSAAALQSATKKFAGQKVLIDYTTKNKPKQTSTTLNTTKEVNSSKDKVYLGVGLNEYSSGFSLIRYTWAAPIVALGLIKQLSVLTYHGLGHALSGLGGIIAGAATHNNSARKNAQTVASNQFVGPVGIYYLLKEYSSVGFQYMLFIVAYISFALAVMNILPLPPLDGGRLWPTLVARALKHPMKARTEEIVNAIGLVIVLMLVTVITYVDIKSHHF